MTFTRCKDMQELYEVSMLLDFYGALLTKRQYELLDIHYNSDYSLGEIAEQYGISRQGVFDNLKRGKSALYSLEEKLGLVKRFSEQQSSVKHIHELIRSLSLDALSEEDCESIRTIESEIEKLLE